MSRKLIATPAFAAILALPIAGYATWHLMETSPLALPRQAPESASDTTTLQKPAPITVLDQDAARQRAEAPVAELEAPKLNAAPQPYPAPAMASPPAGGAAARDSYAQPLTRSMQPAGVPLTAPPPADVSQWTENRDRVASFDGNPVKSALENPVSTFSIDVDTASYSWVRRSLKEGALPQADTVRVEELINYFPYDWKGPSDAATPFDTTVTVMPTPWNAGTRLMHVAVKGYDVPQVARPPSNLVFLVDVSGSMEAPDKLPLLKASFRMLVNQMTARDTVSIVTYAGNAGIALEPTTGADKAKILAAIDALGAGGSTAGEAGLRQAYDLAQRAFVESGVNRVMLATDGDFNVGQTDDADLKRLVEGKRETGVFLSVLGFGRGNLNDTMMQALAQNGNGQAAYIDTLAEAEKTLVQEAGSTLFPIAKDVKIQVEFNPDRIAEYRLIGYETRALAREDFNDDRVDAGEIGSGHSVTAIYEITPKGSPAQVIDDLRYGKPRQDAPSGVDGADEYAFVKIRYKQPNEDMSKLITTPVTPADEVQTFDGASDDQRFSVAVAAFGQKLRGTSQTADLSWDRIAQIATAARGSDPYGYRAEFLSLLRLASALDGRP